MSNSAERVVFNSICSSIRLALQLRSEFDVGFTGGGLMGSSPERPCDDVGRSDAPLSQSRCHAPDLLNGPTDQNATR